MAIANVSLGATTSASAASKTTISVTPSTAPVSANQLVVAGSYHTTGVGSFSDNGAPASVYTVSVTGNNTVQVDMGTTLSVGTAVTTITYSNTGAKGTIAICVAEYSGVVAFGTTNSNASIVSPATVNVSTQDSDDWVAGVLSNNSTGTLTAGASTNIRSSNTTNLDSCEADSGDVPVSGTSTTLSVNLGTAANWVFLAIVLRSSTGAAILLARRALLGVGG